MPCRQITTDIWDDARVQELTSTGQHVLFRLILGPETGPAGATRASVKRIAVDTNLDRTDVEAALDELVAAGLVRRYDDGWMWLPSFIKHQLSGPGFISGIRRQAAQCPDALRKAITRTLDALIGPGKDAIAENRAAKAADTPPPPDGAPRTRKHAPSRQEVDRPSSDHGQTHDTPPSDKGLFEREGQDKDQDRQTVRSVCPGHGQCANEQRRRPWPAKGPAVACATSTRHARTQQTLRRNRRASPQDVAAHGHQRRQAVTHPTDITLRRGEIAEDVAVTIAGRYGATVTALTDATVIRIDGGQRERPGRGAARYAPPLSVILMGGPAGTGALATIRHRPRPTWKAWRADLRDAYLAALTPPHHDEVA